MRPAEAGVSFDDALEQMKRGKGVARPGWPSVEFMFWQDRIWAKFRNGAVKAANSIPEALSSAIDWIVVSETVPLVRRGRAKTGNRRRFAPNLAERQAAMRERRQGKA